MSYGQFQFRRDLAANWTSNNPVLLSGELGLETDTNQFKIGDGVTSWTTLAYGGIQGPSGPSGVGNAAVQVVATTNQSLSGLPTIDGVTLTNNARVLLIAQNTSSQNGIWLTPSTGTGSWTRPTDFASNSNQIGVAVDVEAGTQNAASRYILTGTTAIVVDTSPQVWDEVAGGIMNPYTIQGNNTAIINQPKDLTVTQAQAMLNITTIGISLAASKGYNLN